MQTKADVGTREDQHSLAPIQLEAPGIQRELAAIKRGDGWRLTLALLGSVLVTAGVLQWIGSGDRKTGYASAARQLDSLYAQQESAFGGCTILEPQVSQEALRNAISVASRFYGKGYEKQLATCSRALVVLERQLAGLDVPMAAVHRLEGLQAATNGLNRAIGRYRSYLYDPNTPYQVGMAMPQIDNVVIAWGDYDRQRQNLVDALHAGPKPN